MPPRKYHVNNVKQIMAAYTIRDIPLDLWKKARRRAIDEDLDMRTVLLKQLERYVRRGIE